VPGLAVDHRVEAAVRQRHVFATSGVHPYPGYPRSEHLPHSGVGFDGVDVQPSRGKYGGEFAGARPHVSHPHGRLVSQQVGK